MASVEAGVLEPRQDAGIGQVEPPRPKSTAAGQGAATVERRLDDLSPAGVTHEQALIEEARRRQRRRRRRIAAVCVLALVGTGVGFRLGFASKVPATGASQGPPASAPLSSRTPAVRLDRPESLAVAAGGSLLVANQGTNQILRRAPDGALTVIAGTGTAGYRGDGGPARAAELNDPGGLAVAADGTIYVADTGNNRVRAISPSGTITTVAGNGHFGTGGVSASATRAEVARPVAIALGSQGRIYVIDAAGIQLLTPTGTLTTLIPAGPGRLTVGGALTPFFPSAVAVDSIGHLFVADSSPKLLLELSPLGQVLHSWPIYVAQAGLATAPDGSVTIADYGRFAVDRIVHARLSSVATFTYDSQAGLTGTFRPSGVAVASSGRLYVDTDGVNGGTVRPAIATITKTGRVQGLARSTGSRR